MKTFERNLTPRQEQAIIALLNETTTKAAAESVGVSEVTLHRWSSWRLFAKPIAPPGAAPSRRRWPSSRLHVGCCHHPRPASEAPATSRVNRARGTIGVYFGLRLPTAAFGVRSSWLGRKESKTLSL